MSGLNAYAATGYNPQTRTVILSPVLKASAGTPLLLKGQPSGTYTIPSTEAQTTFVNLFVGNTSGEDIHVGETSGTLLNYYLSGGEFKAVVDNLTVPDSRCYLTLPAPLTAAPTRSLDSDYRIVENDEILTISLGDAADATTDMEELLKAAAAMPDVYVNLKGQRVSTPRKGLYVKGGRKVFVK